MELIIGFVGLGLVAAGLRQPLERGWLGPGLATAGLFLAIFGLAPFAAAFWGVTIQSPVVPAAAP